MSLLRRLMLLLLLVVVALLPAAGIQVYNAIDLHHRQEREVDRQAERLLDLVEAEHNRLIDGIRQVLATVRQTRFARNGEFDACQVFMDRVRPDYPEYIDFYLADGTGTVRCGTEARTTGTFIGDRFHFRQALATGAFTTGEYIARHPTGQAVLTFALPLGNPMGETVGIVAALLDARWLAAYLGTKPLPESAALIVADRNGTVIARVPELPGVVGTRLPDNFQPLLAGTRRETVEMPGLDRVTRVIAYSPVNAPPTGLFLSVGVDKAAAMAPIDRAMLASLGLIAGGLAFILAVLWLGSRRFLCRPVDNLVEATRRWRSGAHAARADTVQVGSEIAVLGKAFNDMATDLESQTKLREQVHDTALRMAEVLASTTDCVFDLDHDWRFTFVNQRAQDQIMEGRDVTGRVIWDVFPKAVGGIFWEQYHRAMGERIPVEFEGFSEYRQRWYAVRAFPSRQGLAVYFQDTTARRAAEERLREQEAQYRAIVETAVDAMVVIDEQGLIQSFNPAAERIFGYGAAEAVGRNIRMLMPEPYHAEHDGYLDHHRRTGERRIIGIGRQVEGRRKDGSTFPLDLSVAEWTVDDHRCFTGIMRDITARKRIETALEDALRRTTEILESIGDGFYAIDGDWRFSYANQRALEIFGRTREDLFGRPFFEAFPEVEGSPVHCNYREVMADRQPREFEALSPILNRWIAFSAYPQAGGGISVHFRDVSAQRAAEAALRASELRYRTLAQALPQLVWTCGADGRCDFLSPQWLAYTGHPEAEQLGYGWVDAIHTDDRERLVVIWQRSVETGTLFDTEARIRGADGSYRWFKQRAIPLADAAGAVTQWFGTSTDISGVVEARDALKAAKEEAERASVAKSRFLASASHDLRQPMQSLFFFAAALEPHVENAEGKRTLMHLERGLDALKGLLDSLLDVSRLDAGVVKPTIEDFPIALLFDHLAASYAPVAAGKGLDWCVVPCSQSVRSDRVLLGRMLRNLIENAVRYTEHGRILVDCRPVGGHLRIEVRDTGIGIPEDHLNRIWEEFHQVGNPERDRTQGLGLGLAIVRRIARLLGYRLEVTSRPGEGSAFSLDVPLGSTRPVVEPVPKPAAPIARSGRCALVIDDDAIVLLGLQTMLANWGYEVVIAADAEQAVGRLEAAGRVPDIIVADYRLREGRVGTEAVARVRQACGRQIPGVILTGETGSECQDEVVSLGLGLAFKPVTPRQLGIALDRQMQATE